MSDEMALTIAVALTAGVALGVFGCLMLPGLMRRREIILSNSSGEPLENLINIKNGAPVRPRLSIMQAEDGLCRIHENSIELTDLGRSVVRKHAKQKTKKS